MAEGRVVDGPPIGESIFAAAQALVGTRFRLHGRDAQTGLDCIGLVVVAYGLAGVALHPALEDYPLRGMALPDIFAAFARSGLVARDGLPETGDIALIACGHGQYHVVLIGPQSHVHAHAGLRRVVKTPGQPEGVVGVFYIKI